MILRKSGYVNIVMTTEPRAVVGLCQAQILDLIILDLSMPVLSGYGVIEQLSLLLQTEQYLPILIVTADTSPETKRRALDVGAKDFLTKPFDPTELLLRVRNLLETRRCMLSCRIRIEYSKCVLRSAPTTSPAPTKHCVI